MSWNSLQTCIYTLSSVFIVERIKIKIQLTNFAFFVSALLSSGKFKYRELNKTATAETFGGMLWLRQFSAWNNWQNASNVSRAKLELLTTWAVLSVSKELDSYDKVLFSVIPHHSVITGLVTSPACRCTCSKHARVCFDLSRKTPG